MNTKTRKAVGAIITYNNSILLVHKVNIMDGKNQEKSIAINGEWDFPKGGVKDNETIEKALKREIFEETGISTYSIVKELPPLTFSIPKKHIKHFDFYHQETRMFHVAFMGDMSEVKPDLEEIDCLQFIEKNLVKNKLYHESSKRYFSKSSNLINLI